MRQQEGLSEQTMSAKIPLIPPLRKGEVPSPATPPSPAKTDEPQNSITGPAIQLGRPQQVHYSGQMPPRNHPTTPTVFPLPLGRGLGRGPSSQTTPLVQTGLIAQPSPPAPLPNRERGVTAPSPAKNWQIGESHYGSCRNTCKSPYYRWAEG